jgi:acyl-CoA reductase-like NAD-dependent aldehyde dehydrogenase
MTIGGQPIPPSRTFDVINPATGIAFAEAPDCTDEQLDAAFSAAREALPAWRSDPGRRASALAAAAEALAASAEEVAPLLVREQGKPLTQAVEEIQGAAGWLAYHAGLDLPREIIQDDDTALVELVRRPVGVVAGITPWNFPLVLACWKIGPALAAGCTMVLKPSPFTPLSTLAMVERLNRVLPAGVLNAVSGQDPLGARMTEHPVPRKISFTGSIATGKRIAAAVAPDLKRVTLELGGNDAAIILDDADPATIADSLFAASFYNAGQVCCAIKRVYAPQSMYDELVDALAARAAAMTVGDGLEDGTQMGPINNRPQFDRVAELTSAAVADGATPVAGGSPLDRSGYFFRPTVLAGARDGMRVVDEEQFGPVLPVISYRELDDAVSSANATMYGLSGSVWGTDEDRATSVAARLECGTAWVNTHLAIAPHQPFGGYKWSGIGVENGPWGLHGFTELQVVHRAKATAASKG